MLRIVLVIACLVLATPAAAHSLRVFATVVGDRVEGYGFFVGGGRPSGVAWTAEVGDTTIASGRTDAEGAFAFTVPTPVANPVRVTIDAGDGHAASKTLAPDRFAGGDGPSSAGAEMAPAPSSAILASPDTAGDAASHDLAQMVELAVARQVEPVLARIEEMDARLRFADVLSGLFFILGLAGMALWALGRRR